VQPRPDPQQSQGGPERTTRAANAALPKLRRRTPNLGRAAHRRSKRAWPARLRLHQRHRRCSRRLRRPRRRALRRRCCRRCRPNQPWPRQRRHCRPNQPWRHQHLYRPNQPWPRQLLCPRLPCRPSSRRIHRSSPRGRDHRSTRPGRRPTPARAPPSANVSTKSSAPLLQRADADRAISAMLVPANRVIVTSRCYRGWRAFDKVHARSPRDTVCGLQLGATPHNMRANSIERSPPWGQRLVALGASPHSLAQFALRHSPIALERYNAQA
jgi:hypothetical protein